MVVLLYTSTISLPETAQAQTPPTTAETQQIRNTLKSIRKKFSVQLNQTGDSDKTVLPVTSHPMQNYVQEPTQHEVLKDIVRQKEQLPPRPSPLGASQMTPILKAFAQADAQGVQDPHSLYISLRAYPQEYSKYSSGRIKVYPAMIPMRLS